MKGKSRRVKKNKRRTRKRLIKGGAKYKVGDRVRSLVKENIGDKGELKFGTIIRVNKDIIPEGLPDFVLKNIPGKKTPGTEKIKYEISLDEGGLVENYEEGIEEGSVVRAPAGSN